MYKKTISALIAVCIILTMGLLGVSVAFGITHKNEKLEKDSLNGSLENVYKRNYYEFSYQMSNVGDSLNKLLVSYSPSYQQKLLTEVSEDTASAIACISTISDTTANGEKTVAFINKVGDYAKSLNYKIARGKSIDNKDKADLTAVYNAVLTLNRSLSEMSDKIEDDYRFLESLDTKNDLFASFFTNIEMDIKYPSLIYDGPFSDALEEKTPSLSGAELNKEQAQQKADIYLPFDGKTEYVTESTDSVASYIFSAKNNSDEYYVTVAKAGGWLVSITSNGESDENNISEDEAVRVANEYLTALGITDTEAVWCSDYNSIYYINFVCKVQDTLIYPDMIKIKVSAKDGSIMGFEGLNYIYNHKQRNLATPKISEDEAKEMAKDIEIERVRLALIPTDGGGEMLCWEIAGTTNEDYYFIYIDANDGDEINVFRVIDSGQGSLLV